jgi:hypothetical protein
MSINFNVAMKYLKDIAKQVKNQSVKVGIPKEAVRTDTGESLAMIGMVHEFGSDARNIPERSFLRANLNQNKKEYNDLLAKLSTKVTANQIDTKSALSIVGNKVMNDTKNYITNLKAPPNSQATIDKKGSSNPLFDTGELRRSIIYKVNND